jgi:uncharacterized protein
MEIAAMNDRIEKRIGEHVVIHDNNKSGALIAWEYFHPGTEAPMLIKHIDDRDRWQFKLEGTKEFSAALCSYRPWNFEQWKELNNQLENYDDHCGDFPHFIFKDGAAILRAQDAQVTGAVKQARGCFISVEWAQGIGYEGLAVNATNNHSEVGHELAAQSGTYGLVWHMKASGAIKASLRSKGDYDVS